MTAPHKATPEQWAQLQACTAIYPGAWGDCIIELRDRIAALEAGATCPHIVTSDEGTSYCGLAEQGASSSAGLTGSPWPADVGPLLWVLWHHQGSKSPVGQAIRKYLGMGQFESMTDRQIGSANQYQELPIHSSVPQPAPAGGLVERVNTALGAASGLPSGNWTHCADAAILAVADWLNKEAESHLGGGVYWSRRLREDVQRND